MDRRFDDVRFLFDAFGRVPDELDALDDAAAADNEHLNDGAARAHLHAEDIAIAELHRRHLLRALLHRFDGAHCIAQLRRLFVSLFRRGAQHAIFQLIGKLLVAPLEKQFGVVDGDGVTLRTADRHDTRSETPFDVVFETWTRTQTGDHFVAGANAKHFVRQSHRPARKLGRQKGTRIQIAVALYRSRDQHAWERLGGRQLQVGIVFVVAQQDVVARRALLDDVVLERQRFDDRVGDDHLDARRFIEQRIVARAHAVGVQVRARPIAQGAGLADVKRLSVGVVIDINARLLRQPGNLVLEVLDHGISDFRLSDDQL